MSLRRALGPFDATMVVVGGIIGSGIFVVPAVVAQRLLARNAPLVAEFFDSRPELECVPSNATIAFPRFRDGRDAEPSVRKLFEERGVAVVPGSFFDAPAHFRIAFGGAPETVERGLEAIAACLADS